MLEEIKALAGDGIVVVVDGEGTKLVDMNAERAFIPASTLKVVTGLASIEVLGPDHRFETRFYVDEAGWLYVEGRGDPFLVSEELDLLAPALLAKGKTEFTGIVLDDSYYSDGIKIPGTSGSDRPYDSLNSALAVNFNTLFVVISGGTVTSAEEQTPVVPISVEAAKESGHSGEIRINLASDPSRALLYAGQLVRAKLTEHGATIGDEMRSGTVPEGLEPLYVHANSRPLSEVVGSMLYWSNNYAANQLLLEMGALRLGEPATLDKGVEVVRGVLTEHGLADSISSAEAPRTIQPQTSSSPIVIPRRICPPCLRPGSMTPIGSDVIHVRLLHGACDKTQKTPKESSGLGRRLPDRGKRGFVAGLSLIWTPGSDLLGMPMNRARDRVGSRVAHRGGRRAGPGCRTGIAP
ncbi:MAG: D-alanyl-D-alanine carboxypeptidase, partial [Myxococcota bacterium]|nr:D-alanyl-D-alanine carboxypeptidase [Myxococcota bacterium]